MAGHGAEIPPLTSCPVTTARWLRCLVRLLHRPIPFRLVISFYEVNETLTRYSLEYFRCFMYWIILQLVAVCEVTVLPPLFENWNFQLVPISKRAHSG